jgi:hypothetical protein
LYISPEQQYQITPTAISTNTHAEAIRQIDAITQYITAGNDYTYVVHLFNSFIEYIKKEMVRFDLAPAAPVAESPVAESLVAESPVVEWPAMTPGMQVGAVAINLLWKGGKKYLNHKSKKRASRADQERHMRESVDTMDSDDEDEN